MSEGQGSEGLRPGRGGGGGYCWIGWWVSYCECDREEGVRSGVSLQKVFMIILSVPSVCNVGTISPSLSL